MPVKKKNPNPTIELLPSDKESKLDYLGNIKTYRLIPITEAKINKLIADIQRYTAALSDPDNNYRIVKVSQVIRLLGYKVNTLDRWFKSYPELHDAYNELLCAIGDLREQRGLERTYDSAMVRTSMYLYDKSWPSPEDIASATPPTIIVNMESPSQTEEVTNQINGKARITDKPEQV